MKQERVGAYSNTTIRMLMATFPPSAQSLFLASTEPQAALRMRRDLLQWDHALKLAATLDKKQIPAICREYAQQLEVQGETQQALDKYVRPFKLRHYSVLVLNTRAQPSCSCSRLVQVQARPRCLSGGAVG